MTPGSRNQLCKQIGRCNGAYEASYFLFPQPINWRKILKKPGENYTYRCTRWPSTRFNKLFLTNQYTIEDQGNLSEDFKIEPEQIYKVWFVTDGDSDKKRQTFISLLFIM